MQSRAVAPERQDEPAAIAETEKNLGSDERLDHRAGVEDVTGDPSADDPGPSAVCRAAIKARRIEQLDVHIRRVVDAAPPLTVEQRDKLALLLRGPSIKLRRPPLPSEPK
ncbi:hypothetical protein [Geodermatophilus sp. CPCC 205506]|uniref:hypothetical protein n=1 Tax=Geodermatophilus sp. CPCC 205506 TaxID=2936596 RepID=UPI003EEDC018